MSNVLKVVKAKRLIMELIVSEFPNRAIKFQESLWVWSDGDKTQKFYLYIGELAGKDNGYSTDDYTKVWNVLTAILKLTKRTDLLDDPRVKAIGELNV